MIKQTKVPNKKRGKPDKGLIADLALNKDLSCRQIESITGLAKSRVAEIIQEVKTKQDFLDFQNNKDTVFENLQYRLINLADDDLLKTMLSKRGFTDTAILQDKIQQLRGQETQVNSTQIAVFINSVINRCVKDVPEVCQASETETNQVIDIPVIDGLLGNLKDNK